MQSETVAVFARGEAVIEDALEVLRRDADAGIDDGDQHRAIGRPHADGHALLGAPGLVAGVFGVADHVHQDLQHLVLVDRDQRHLLEVAHQRDAMTAEGPLVHPQAVLDQRADVDHVGHAAAARVALLHRDDFLDVLDVAAQRRQLRAGRITLGDELGRQLLQVHRQVPALRTRQESRQVGRVLAQERSRPVRGRRTSIS